MDLYTAPFSCPVASLLIPLMEVNHSRGTRWNYLKGGMPLATTHIIPIHINKSKTLAQCLSDRMGYGENPEKTNGGEYHAVIDGQTNGPFSETTMMTMAAEGNLSSGSPECRTGRRLAKYVSCKRSFLRPCRPCLRKTAGSKTATPCGIYPQGASTHSKKNPAVISR